MDFPTDHSSLSTNSLTLDWAFGFNKDVVDGVHSLCAGDREAIFYIAAHTGVIYDYRKRTQDHLQARGPDPLMNIIVLHFSLKHL